MSSESTIAKSSIWSFLGQVMVKFFSFLYTILIARLLVPAEVGSFYLALSVISVIFIFTDFGIDYAIGRYTPYLFGKKEFGKLHELVRMSYSWGSLLTLIFTIAVFLLSDQISILINSPEISSALKILSLYLIVNEIFTISSGILRGRKRIKDMYLINSIQGFLKLILLIPLIYILGPSSGALAAGFLLSFVLVLPIGLYWVIKETRSWPKEEKKLNTHEKISFGKEIIYFGFVTSLVIGLSSLIEYSDIIMLGYFSPSRIDIGIYSIATGLANLVLIFPSSISSIFFPIVAELHGKDDKKGVAKITATSFNWVVLTTLPIVILFLVFSENLLTLFYGESYAPGWIVMLFFTLAIFIRSTFSICGSTLAAMHKLGIQLKIIGLAAIVNIILNLILIPAMGINGAAIAALISLGLSALLTYYYSKKIFGFNIPKQSYKPLLAGLLAFIILVIIKAPILGVLDEFTSIGIQLPLLEQFSTHIVKLAVFGFIFFTSLLLYLFLLIALRAFGPDEISLLQSGLKRMKVSQKQTDKLLWLLGQKVR